MTTTSNNSRRVPLHKRKRTETSCDKCKSRKQKCTKEPGQDACVYCEAHKVECLTTQPRKKRLYGSVEGLGHRLALLESLVKGLIPEADTTNMDEMRQLGKEMGIPLPDAVAGEQAGEGKSGSATESEEPMSLLPDQQGQAQYIGPSSSFSFHLKLRALVGQGAAKEFVLFGRNAADPEPAEGDSDPHSLSTPSAASNVDHTSPVDQRSQQSDGPSLEMLTGAFFDHINPDFPVLHEASFHEAYEKSFIKFDKADPAWMCGFLSVLLLSNRVARASFPEDQERLWWKRVQSLLPVVIFTSSIAAVQALMLTALHLHNTNHRDACWNLTGTAVRIAVGIGLHQDKVNTMQTPLTRELRKRLWWTLYAFEQMQVSSYDRPSAIEHPGSKIGCPNERIIGMAGYCPPDYSKWFNRLVVHLGSACRAPKNTKANASEESYVGPLSPAAGVLRDLKRWKEGLPLPLHLEAADSSPESFQRPLLLLHAMFHYTTQVLCRAALLSRATTIYKEGKDSTNSALIDMADACTESSRALAKILLKLDSIAKFDPITWWDIWYTLSSASNLVLDLVCMTKRESGTDTQSRVLLAQLAELAQKHRQNTHMPGTIEKWASIIPELHSMSDSMESEAPQAHLTKVESDSPSLDTSPSKAGPHAHAHAHALPPPLSRNAPPAPHPSHPVFEPYPYHQYSAPALSTTNSGAYMFSDNLPGRGFPGFAEFPGGSAGSSNLRAERGESGNGNGGGGGGGNGVQNPMMQFTMGDMGGDWGLGVGEMWDPGVP